ncbi:class I SAM-dependent methyltransferase [Microbacterium sp. MAHUQ-60]|uniref:class I SAM-dependent methyltransferase n=1 Tax=unclassified Microbacterium TaxID=2609290 RepID=UPI0036183CD3
MTNGPGVRWNHNIHYHRLILDAVPAAARTALDVGTGNGLLAADLHRRVPHVTGLDTDSGVLDSARREVEGVRWLQGDVMTYPFAEAQFDVVASVATLHHLPDLDAALRRLAMLTAPGGVVAIVGLARSSQPLDLVFDIAGLVQHRRYTRRFGLWEHSAPAVWPPPHSYAEVRRSAARMLPGAQWSRLPLWRYAVIWTRPGPMPDR